MLFPNIVSSQTRPSLRTKLSKRTVVLLVSVKREQASAKRPYTTTSRKRTFGPSSTKLQPKNTKVYESSEFSG